MQKIRVAILGCGRMGMRHADAYKKNPLATIAGFYDVKSSIASNVAAHYRSNSYKDIDEIMSDSNIDAVSICTPNSQHYETLDMAIKASKHILVEKPIVTTERHCDLLEKTAKKYKKKIMVGHTHRFYQCNIALRSVLDSGIIGKPKIINIFDYIPGKNPGQSVPSWTKEKKFGGGILMTDFIHTVDKLSWFTSKAIKKVHTHMLSNFITRGSVEDAIMCTIELEGDLIANCIHSCPSPGTTDMSTKIIGTEGEVRMTFANEIAVLKESITQIDYPFRGNYMKHSTNAFYSEIDEFVKSIIEKREPKVSLNDGICAVRAVLALEKSYKVKRPITLKK